MKDDAGLGGDPGAGEGVYVEVDESQIMLNPIIKVNITFLNFLFRK